MIWPHIKGLPLEDPEYLANDPVELLLGAEVCSLIFQDGLRKGGPQAPMAQKTILGWILSGGCGVTDLHGHRSSLQCTTDHDLVELVRRFWEQEEVPSSPAALAPEEERCEDIFARTHKHAADGRYIVRLPFSATPTNLTETRKPAERLLSAMERKCGKESQFGELYRSFMQEYENLQHMSQVRMPPTFENQDNRCYLPHHVVLRESSATTKLRVVFNGSQRLRSGESLNSQLLVGANLLPALADVILRWRWHRFAVMADIEKMYRQILVHPDDRDYQRVLWRHEVTGDIREYRLNIVTYGLACAPFLAIRTLRQLADDEESRFPQGAAALRRDCYVDDIVTWANTLSDATLVQSELRELCMAGGFPLRKWAANREEILEGIPQEHQLLKTPHTWEDESHSTLGIRWHPRDDYFAFAIQPRTVTEFTKRRVLAETARLFDPLGWLAPVVIRAKVLIQSAWLQGLDWDSPLPPADTFQWRFLLEELPLLERVRIPRWLQTGAERSNVQIHGFADASERGYAAVLYLRTSNGGATSIHLLAAKSKVAPIRQVSLPRLELCVASLLTSLTYHIRASLNLSTAPAYLWSDSKLLLPDAQWRHLPGRDNPADCASRGIAPSELIQHPLWWTGPAWLCKDETSWPDKSLETLSDELPETRTATFNIAAEINTEPELLLQFSSLHRLLKVTAWCLRWRCKDARRQPSGNATSPLQPAELDNALFLWLRVVRQLHYAAEIAAVVANRTVANQSSLARLSPFLDDTGVLRIG